MEEKKYFAGFIPEQDKYFRKIANEMLEQSIQLFDILFFIQAKYPEHYVFRVNEWAVSVINKDFQKRNYRGIMFNFGINFLLCFLRYFEKNENYEECQLIKKAIDETNERLWVHGDLPTYEFIDREKALKELKDK